jgi:predicted TIM-barrel fold metal-dependent hydrolase
MLLEDGAAGFAIYLLLEDDGRALGGWPAALLAELRERRVIVSLNVRPAAAAAIQDVVDALEGCPILVSHLGLPGRFARPPAPGQAREVLAPLLALASRAHVAAKLSGLYAISDPAHDFPHAAAQPFADLLLDTFGPARLLWGSDFAPALEFVSFAQTVDLRVLVRCSPAEIDDVMGGNLLRLLDRREQ